MRYIAIKKILIIPGVAALLAVTPGCFTGVESTPRIQDTKGGHADSKSSAEDDFFASVQKQPPGEWHPGKRFTVVDDRFKRLLGASAPPTDLKGHTLTLQGIIPVPTVLGDSVIEINFTSQTSDTPLIFRTNLTPGEWRTRSAFSIPFLVETDMIEVADRLLSGKQLWVKTRTGWINGRIRRFVPVEVDSVVPGNETYPMKVSFHAQDTPGEHGAVYVTDAGTRVDDRHAFAAYFSLTDMRSQYPGISNANWQAIINGALIVGMSPEEVRLALGAPQEIRNNNTSSILRQQWLYADGRVLQFENKALVSWN